MIKGPGSFQMLLLVVTGIVAFFILHRELKHLKREVEKVKKQLVMSSMCAAPVMVATSVSESVPAPVHNEVEELPVEDVEEETDAVRVPSIEEKVLDDDVEMKFTDEDIKEIMDELEEE